MSAFFGEEGKKFAIVGATGAVGIEIVKVLKERKIPVASLGLFASARSAGKTIETAFGNLVIELFSVEAVRCYDFVFLAVSGSFALENGPKIIADNGPYVIDNSSAFRYQPEIPLVVPEINAESIGDSRLIANPNCTTAIAAMPLWPIHCRYGIKKMIVSTYQAASGAGAEGMTELSKGCGDYLSGKTPVNEIFSHPLPFNVIPQIDAFQKNGYTKEEMKVVWETQKIFGKNDMLISCTAVRIPTLRAHAESITIETEKEIDPDDVRVLLKDAPGVAVVDDPENSLYPMPLTATEKYAVEVGRIRTNIVFGKNGLDLFLCGDQLLRGAALNAVLIAEKLL